MKHIYPTDTERVAWNCEHSDGCYTAISNRQALCGVTIRRGNYASEGEQPTCSKCKSRLAALTAKEKA